MTTRPRNTILLAIPALACAIVLSGCLSIKPSLSLSRDRKDDPRMARAVEINAENAHAWFILAKGRMSDGRHEEARSAFRRALSLKEDFEEAYAGIGLSYLTEKNWKSAIAAFEVLNKRNPKSLPALEGLAAAKLGLGDLDGAQVYGTQAVAVGRKSATAHRVLGEVAYIRGDYEKAIDHWDIAVEDGRFASELEPVLQDLRQYTKKYEKK